MHNVITGKCHEPLQFTEEEIKERWERTRQREEGRARVKKEQEVIENFKIREYLDAAQLRHRHFVLQGHNARRTMQDMDFGKIEKRCLAAMAHESNLEEKQVDFPPIQAYDPDRMTASEVRKQASKYGFSPIQSMIAEREKLFNAAFVQTVNDTEQDWW